MCRNNSDTCQFVRSTLRLTKASLLISKANVCGPQIAIVRFVNCLKEDTMTQTISAQRRFLRNVQVALGLAVVLGVLTGVAISAQDKYTVKVPGGLAFSEFRGYEGW